MTVATAHSNAAIFSIYMSNKVKGTFSGRGFKQSDRNAAHLKVWVTATPRGNVIIAPRYFRRVGYPEPREFTLGNMSKGSKKFDYRINCGQYIYSEFGHHETKIRWGASICEWRWADNIIDTREGEKKVWCMIIDPPSDKKLPREYEQYKTGAINRTNPITKETGTNIGEKFPDLRKAIEARGGQNTASHVQVQEKEVQPMSMAKSLIAGSSEATKPREIEILVTLTDGSKLRATNITMACLTQEVHRWRELGMKIEDAE